MSAGAVGEAIDRQTDAVDRVGGEGLGEGLVDAVHVQ
jgi:hypothetical protein